MGKSYVLQTEGSSFLQMGASLEQQVLCMFKVHNARERYKIKPHLNNVKGI